MKALGLQLVRMRFTPLRSFLAISVAATLATIVGAQAGNPSINSQLMQQLQQALALAQRGDRQGAMRIDLQLLEQNPKFVPAIKLKGMLLEESGQAAEAGATDEEGLKLAPNDPDLLLKTGIYKLASGERELAIKLLQRCTRILPSDGDAQYYLAQAYHLNGQDNLALPAMRASLKAQPDNHDVWQKYGELLCSTGDCAGGLRWLLKTQRADTALPRIDFDIATANYKLMDFDGAARYAGRAVQSQPDDLKSLQLLATSNGKLAHWQEAKTAYERIRALKGDDAETLLGLGQCELELKSYQSAVETLQSVLRLDPNRFLAHFYLSRAYAAMGRAEDAQHEASLHQLMMRHATFVPAVEIEQRESPIKPQAQQLLAAHREDEAVRLFREHFSGTSATTADAYVFIGKLYLFAGKTGDGIRCLHHALKIKPTVRGAHTYEGILALKQNELGAAEKQFEAELTNDPSYQLAIAEMGEVRYHQERWADAAEHLAKSRTMTPELLYMLCDAYFHLGKIEDANLTAEATVAYSRNKPEVVQGLMDLLTRNGQSEVAKRIAPVAR